MTTIALVGADGSGKTTVSRQLVEESPTSLKYLYMGPSIESSNVALPWSRLFLRLKLLSYRREAKREGITDPSFVSTHHGAHRSVKRGPVTSILRMVNRLAEGVYRQSHSCVYQLRGYVVLYDRHFLFDEVKEGKHRPRSDRIYYWILNHVFPKPDLVLFLDAPVEILFARKGEGTVDYLERKRQDYIAQSAKVSQFIWIDANRPLQAVCADVNRYVRAVARDKRLSRSS